MRVSLQALLFIATAAALVAQEPLSADMQQAFDNYTKLPDVLLPVLRGITDRAGADEAAPKLHELLPQVYDTRSAIQSIKELSPEQAALVRQRYEQTMREKWGAFYAEIFRLRRANCYGSPAMSKEFYLLCMMLNQ